MPPVVSLAFDRAGSQRQMQEECFSRIEKTEMVWDAGLRAFHWLLVLLVAGALWTGLAGGKQWLDVHVWLGTAISALLVFRLVWGFLGPTYARFRTFPLSVTGALCHLWGLLGGSAPHHLGHNPLGAAMIWGLLTALAVIAGTGAMTLGGVIKEGPLAAVIPFATGAAAGRVHEIAAWLLLALIGLHVAGVAIESLRTGENLAAAMITGRKRAAKPAHAAPPAAARPALAAAIVVALIAALGAGIGHLAARPALGVPAAPLDAAYAKECGACHTPHHPSLAPIATWTSLMRGLENHFGDNAGLDAATTRAIASYLAANAAEHWDTRGANLLRQPSPAEPLRITATPGWRRLHTSVAESRFAAREVGGRVNCSACHRDAASGRFAPRAIAVPSHAPEEKPL